MVLWLLVLIYMLGLLVWVFLRFIVWLTSCDFLFDYGGSVACLHRWCLLVIMMFAWVLDDL